MKFFKEFKVSAEFCLAIFLMASFVVTNLVNVYLIKESTSDRINKIDDAMMTFWTHFIHQEKLQRLSSLTASCRSQYFCKLAKVFNFSSLTKIIASVELMSSNLPILH